MSEQQKHPHILGLTEDQAKEVVETAGLTFRVTSRDGDYYMVTGDYRTDRLNVDIVDGKVIRAVIG